MKPLIPFQGRTCTHFTPVSIQMSKKSDVVVFDVLLKNETKNTNMLHIMQTMQGYLGEEFCRAHKILPGCDQLVRERQVNC